MTKTRLFIRRFTGVDVSGYPADGIDCLLAEAKYLRSLEVGLIADAVASLFRKE